MQRFFDTIWYQKPYLGWLLAPLSALFYLLSHTRRFLLQQKNTQRLSKPVIIVGNISVGGTGKTPLLIAIVSHLQQQGLKPAVISRGYGGKADYPYALNDQSRAAQSGDEPLLIYRRCGCPVVVAPDRLQAANYVAEHYDVDVIISDDGLQHYALPRDIEIAVVDGKRGLGNGFCLPAGPLRETAGRLKTVDFVVVNGDTTQQFATSQYSMQIKAQQPVALFANQQTLSLENQVHAVAGIGNPQRFFTTLAQQGFQAEPHVFADHYAFKENDVCFADTKPVIMTEKDAVKCLDFSNLTRHWYLPVSAQLPDVFWQALDQQLHDFLKKD